MTTEQKIQWCIDQHKNANHFYDKYLPYEFHLRMVANVYDKFLHLLERRWTDVLLACYGHDLIEDARCSYNDVSKVLGDYAADIVYACTNEKGKNRAERANDKYYSGIVNTEGAVFVKMCDRIANVQYSKMTKSRMFEMYKAENGKFIESLKAEKYGDMVDYLNSLFIE